MCGYVERDIDTKTANPLGPYLPGPVWDKLCGGPLQRFYPAFGGSQKTIRDVIINPAGIPQAVDAVWWYDCTADGDNLLPGQKYGFNARNLNYPVWQEGLRHRRAVVLATGIGETRQADKAKFLMRSDEPFALGALYNHHSNGRFSVTIITRNPHPRFSEFHEKALPLFLPIDQDFIRIWLDPSIKTHPEIDYELGHPKLRVTFHVSKVKTFSRPETAVEEEELVLDADC